MAKKKARKIEGSQGNFSRGSDTMFRVAFDTHLNLSRMADRKAHLMLGINAFLLSFVVTKKKMGILSHQEGLLIPDIMLVVFTMSCIVLAILATRPNLPKKLPNPKDPGFNWLFFGHFAYSELPDFLENIYRISSDDLVLQEAMTNDLY
ncbi:MAG: hypothetical protein IPL65_08700 [Lewinellaceae bacterium]|nr:hypothetical protein [Lewinellaceae bacterium]